MFNTHRRDILNFDNYMNLKKPGFGGPSSAIELRDTRGNLIDKTPKLDGYRRTVERDPAFSHPVYDPTYKAMTHDLIYKQEKKKPFTYDDTRTGIPVVEIEPVKEGKTYTSFERFINETDDYSGNEQEKEDGEYIPEYTEDNSEEEETEENEFRTESTRSNQTMSDLKDIEDKLRSFESDEEVGANPIDYEEDDTPFGKKPDWIKELEKNNSEY